MEIKYYTALFWRWSWLVVLFAILSGGIAFGISQASQSVYRASTTLLINLSPASQAQLDYQTVLTSERLARTFAELLRKPLVLDTVIKNLDLSTDPDTLGSQVSVAVVRDTQLITLSVDDHDPQQAADIANAIVDVFIDQNRQLQSSRFAESMQSLRSELDRIQADIDATEASLTQITDLSTEAAQSERTRLEEQLTRYRDSYTSLLKSFEEVRLADAQAATSISVVEAARPNVNPVAPKTLQNMLLAVLVGVILALGIVFLLDHLDDTVKTMDGVQQAIQTSTLASIPHVKAMKLEGPLMMTPDHYATEVEAYRMLRVNIGFASIDREIRTLLVTSGSPGEGKSTTAANLAVAIAQTGKRVILVDTDLRRPTLLRMFHKQGVRGFTNALLVSEGDVERYLLPTEVPTLSLLPSGPLPPNPTELLGSQRMADLVASLKQHADIVIFDSPPVLNVADAAVLVRHCDATILVARAAKTSVSALKRTHDQLVQTGTKLLGIVLNDVAVSRSKYYYTYYGRGNRPRPGGRGDRGRTTSPATGLDIGLQGSE